MSLLPSRRACQAFLVAALLVLPAASARSQGEEPPAEPASQPAAEAVDETPEPAPSGATRYRRGSFRDPFRSLLDQQKKRKGPRPPGVPGMLIEEVDLVGILAGPKGNMVLIIGSDGLGYSLTEGAELYDGHVLSIDQASRIVVFRQEVNDPTRIKPYRDIERRLDPAS